MRRCHTRRAQRHASRDGGHASELLQQLRSGLQSLLYHRCIDCERFDDDDDLFDILYTSGPRRCGVDGNVHGLFIEHSIDLAFYDDNDSLFERLVLHPPSFPLLLLVHTIGPTTTTITTTSTTKEQRSDVVIVWPARKEKKQCDIPAGKAKQEQVVFFWQSWCILSILKCRQTASHSREEYITSSSNFFFNFFDRLWYVYKGTREGVTETEIRYI